MSDIAKTLSGALFSGTPKTEQPAKRPVSSGLFSETLAKSLAENTVSSLGGSPSVSLSDGAGPLSSALLSSAAAGEASEKDLSLFLLLMMMKESEGTDLEPLMGSVASLLQEESSASARPDAVRNLFDPLYAAPLRQTQFKAAPRAEGLSIPSRAWIPCSFSVVSTPSERNPELLRRVIDQFSVETSERYRPHRTTGRDTYCNIFLWDVTSALGCEIPHYVDRKTGEPRVYPDVSGAYELDANGVCDWLFKSGAGYGWREVSAEEAQAAANAGKPAVTAWKNTSGRGAGHVQVVSPSRDGKYDASRGVAVAQSGGKNSSYTHISNTFGRSALREVRYFVHD